MHGRIIDDSLPVLSEAPNEPLHRRVVGPTVLW